MDKRKSDPDRDLLVVAVLDAVGPPPAVPDGWLADVSGVPLLLHQAERIERAPGIRSLVIVVREGSEGDAVAAACAQAGVETARGNGTDAVEGCYRASLPRDPGHVAYVRAGCPMADPGVIGRAVTLHLDRGADYTSNTTERSFPRGLEVEVVRFETLQDARTTTSDAQTFGERCRTRARRMELLRQAPSRADLRWVVEDAADLSHLRALIAAKPQDQPGFSAEDVYALIEREPRLAKRASVED